MLVDTPTQRNLFANLGACRACEGSASLMLVATMPLLWTVTRYNFAASLRTFVILAPVAVLPMLTMRT